MINIFMPLQILAKSVSPPATPSSHKKSSRKQGHGRGEGEREREIYIYI